MDTQINEGYSDSWRRTGFQNIRPGDWVRETGEGGFAAYPIEEDQRVMSCSYENSIRLVSATDGTEFVVEDTGPLKRIVTDKAKYKKAKGTEDLFEKTTARAYYLYAWKQHEENTTA